MLWYDTDFKYGQSLIFPSLDLEQIWHNNRNAQLASSRSSLGKEGASEMTTDVLIGQIPTVLSCRNE